MTLERLRQQVFLLPLQDRTALIRDLIDSLEASESREQISQSWLHENAARSDVLLCGEMECDD